jgi:hypothetical protein
VAIPASESSVASRFSRSIQSTPWDLNIVAQFAEDSVVELAREQIPDRSTSLDSWIVLAASRSSVRVDGSPMPSWSKVGLS